MAGGPLAGRPADCCYFRLPFAIHLVKLHIKQTEYVCEIYYRQLERKTHGKSHAMIANGLQFSLSVHVYIGFRATEISASR